MRLEDFIQEIKNSQKVKEPEIRFIALDINSYPNISKNKKELLKSVYNYFDDEKFMDAIYRYEHDDAEYAYYQSCSNDGTRGLIRVKICDLKGSYDIPCHIDKNKFYHEYNRGVKTGAQKYTFINILTHYDRNDPEFSSYITIYYTIDGKIFVSPGAAKEIEKKSELELGKILAYKCIELEKEKERYKSRRRNNN